MLIARYKQTSKKQASKQTNKQTIKQTNIEIPSNLWSTSRHRRASSKQRNRQWWGSWFLWRLFCLRESIGIILICCGSCRSSNIIRGRSVIGQCRLSDWSSGWSYDNDVSATGRHHARVATYCHQDLPIGKNTDDHRYEKIPHENEHSLNLPFTTITSCAVKLVAIFIARLFIVINEHNIECK